MSTIRKISRERVSIVKNERANNIIRRTARRASAPTAAPHGAVPDAGDPRVADRDRVERRSGGRGHAAAQRRDPGNGRAVLLVDQAELPDVDRRYVLAAHEHPRAAVAGLLRHDDRRRRLGAHRSRPSGLELPDRRAAVPGRGPEPDHRDRRVRSGRTEHRPDQRPHERWPHGRSHRRSPHPPGPQRSRHHVAGRSALPDALRRVVVGLQRWHLPEPHVLRRHLLEHLGDRFGLRRPEHAHRRARLHLPAAPDHPDPGAQLAKRLLLRHERQRRRQQRDQLPVAEHERGSADPVRAGVHPAPRHGRRRHDVAAARLGRGGADDPTDARLSAGEPALAGHRPQHGRNGAPRLRPRTRRVRQHDLRRWEVPLGPARSGWREGDAELPGGVRP